MANNQFHFTPIEELNQPTQAGFQVEKAQDAAPGARHTTEQDVLTASCNEDGAQYVLPHGPQIWQYVLSSSSQQTDTVVHAAPGANLSNYITDVYFGAGGAVTLEIEDEDNNLYWAYPAQAAGDGVAMSFRTPIKIPANKALEIDTSAAVQVYVTITGYIAP